MAKKIALTKGQTVLVDDDMYPFLNRWNWHIGTHGYAARGTGTTGTHRTIYLHRVVAHLMFGDIPDGYVIDHQDGDVHNCTTSNLRLARMSDNGRNRAKVIGVTSTYKGVYWNKNAKRWAAKIRANGRNMHLGYFNDEVDAGRVYDHAARSHFGAFARLNFPDEVM
jgi:hypothetical protein